MAKIKERYANEELEQVTGGTEDGEDMVSNRSDNPLNAKCPGCGEQLPFTSWEFNRQARYGRAMYECPNCKIHVWPGMI